MFLQLSLVTDYGLFKFRNNSETTNILGQSGPTLFLGIRKVFPLELRTTGALLILFSKTNSQFS
jgi:hypothetical protein